MKNRKMFLQVLLSTALVLGLTVTASLVEASGAVRLPDDHDNTSLAADGSGLAKESLP